MPQRPLKFAPWTGSPGVVETLVQAGALVAIAAAATFTGAGELGLSGNTGELAGQAQAATFAGAGGSTMLDLFGADNIQDLSADYVVLGGYLLRTAGTGTAVPQIIGAPSVPGVGVRFEVEAGGVTYKYYADGGTTPIETGIAITPSTTRACIGVLDGVSIVLPSTGTYIAGDIHDARVAGFLDATPYGNDEVNGTLAQQPVFEPVGFNGRACAKGDGTDDITLSTSAGLSVHITGADVPHCVFFSGQQLASAIKAWWCIGGGSTVKSFIDFVYNTTGPKWTLDHLDDASGVGAPSSVVGGGGTADLLRHNFCWNNTGTHVEFYNNTAAIQLSGGFTNVAAGGSPNMDVGQTTLTQSSTFGRRLLTTQSAQANLRLRRKVTIKRTATAAEITAGNLIMAWESPV